MIKGLPKILAAIIIAIAVSCASLFLASYQPENIGATIGPQLYVSGFGFHPAGDVILAAPCPVRTERSGMKMFIRGLLVNKKGTTLDAYVEGPLFGDGNYVPGDSPQYHNRSGAGSISLFEGSYLVDSTGTRYDQNTSWSMGNGSDGRYYDFRREYSGLPAELRHIALVLPSMSNWTIDIPLLSASDLTTADKSIASIMVNGVVFTGQAFSYPGQTLVVLSAQSLRDGQVSGPEIPIVTDALGKTRILDLQGGDIPGEPTYLSIDQNIGNRVTVALSKFGLSQDVRGSTVVPVPQQASSISLNQTLWAGPWKLDLIKAEIVNEKGVPDNSIGLRIYARSSNTYKGATLVLLNKIAVNGDWGIWANEQHSPGGLITVEVPIPKQAMRVKIDISQIEALVNGPWILELPVVSNN